MIPVPRLWPESTIAILAGGPSLTESDIATCRAASWRILAIKEAIRLCPDADVLYACDAKWWKHYGTDVAFPGPRYALEPAAGPWATVLQNTGMTGLELDPSGLRTGKNSGYQAINLAVHLGARRIVLLGYDMQQVDGKNYWFKPRPATYSWVQPPYKDFLMCFDTIVDPLRALGVEVWNATPGSALTVFPWSPVDALPAVAA